LEFVMTDAFAHPNNLISDATSRIVRLAAPVGRAIARTILARATRRALNGLPDDMLADIGLTRSDIPFVVNAIASEGRPLDRASREQRLAA
jgi:uncharacterized protein YjiS (DUF1127 family)